MQHTTQFIHSFLPLYFLLLTQLHVQEKPTNLHIDQVVFFHPSAPLSSDPIEIINPLQTDHFHPTHLSDSFPSIRLFTQHPPIKSRTQAHSIPTHPPNFWAFLGADGLRAMDNTLDLGVEDPS